MSGSAVFGIGTVVVDHLLVLPQLPAPDSKVEAVTDRLQVGGPVPTALAQARRLGRSCAFAGAWGDDPYGALVARELAEWGIDCAGARAIAGATTGLAQVWVCRSTGTRSIAYRRMDPASLPFDAQAAAGLAEARILHLDGWPPATALAAARAARTHGVLVSLDVGNPKPGSAQLLAHVDVVNCPRRQLAALTGEHDAMAGIAALRAQGVQTVTLTDGERGALLAHGETVVEQPAFPVTVADSTGAGDIFCGALLHGLLVGWDPAPMLAFAQAAAALACTAVGNRAGLADAAAIDAFLRERGAPRPGA